MRLLLGLVNQPFDCPFVLFINITLIIILIMIMITFNNISFVDVSFNNITFNNIIFINITFIIVFNNNRLITIINTSFNIIT